MKIVLDIGGTNTRIASSLDGKTLNEKISFPTEQNYLTALQKISDTAIQLSKNGKISSLVVGLPGLLNPEKTFLVHATNLPDWSNKNLAEDLKIKLNTEVSLENDTTLAALGEANNGAGQNFKRVMYISIGTGYGGAWVIDRKLVTGKFNFEPGQQTIDIENNKNLESYVSGKGLEIKFGESMSNVPNEQIWEEIKKPLITGLHNTYLHWPSDIIILGGGFTFNSKLPIENIKSLIHQKLEFYPELPEVQIAQLADESALYGALRFGN